MINQQIRSDTINNLLKLCYSDKETSQYCVHVSGIEENDEKKKKIYYIMITECGFYIFEKSNEFKIHHCHSLFLLEAIEINGNEFKISFKSKNYLFTVPDSKLLYVTICQQIKKLFWNVFTNQIKISRNIEKSPFFELIKIPNSRPPFLLLYRYIAFCLVSSKRPEKKVINVLGHYMGEKEINLPNIWKSKTSKEVAMSLSVESNLKSLILDKFDEIHLDNFLNVILSSKNLVSLELKNYTHAKLKGIILKKMSSTLTTIKINNCSNKFIVEFFMAIQNGSLQISTLIFWDITFETSGIEIISQCIMKSYFCNAITSLGFVRCMCSDSSFLDFALICVAFCKKLENFQVEWCYIDVCDALLGISRCETIIQKLCMRNNTGNTIIVKDTMILPPTLLFIDVGYCEWSPESFVSFISILCSNPRKYPLILSVERAQINTNWDEVFSQFKFDSLYPALTEINFSNNTFDESAIKLFLKFLETQSPLISNKNLNTLNYLNLSNCFSPALSQYCINKIVKFFKKGRNLWGLDVCGIKPSIKYTEIPGLYSLNIGQNTIYDDDIKTIYQIIERAPYLSELGINELSFQNNEKELNFYDTVLSNSKIISFGYPSKFMEYNKEINEIKRLKDRFSKKRFFSSTTQRCGLYLSMIGEFAVNVSPENSFNMNENAGDGSDASQFINSGFRNPILSLLDLSSLATIDLTVHPIANMVAEYVETSGKCGAIPPTAPPIEKPEFKYTISSIFSTIETRNEIEEQTQLEFDPKSNAIKEISKKISSNFTSSNLKNDIKYWDNNEIFLTFQPVKL